MRQLHIHALGINVGGGLVLLEQLLQHNNGALGSVYLDKRVENKISKQENFYYIRHNIINEYISQKRLSKSVHPEDHVLFFSNRPPLISFPCKVSVFHQNALLLEKVSAFDLKAKVNQLWFKLFKKNSDKFVVQNQTMRRLLSKHGCHNTSVINAPFFDLSSDLNEYPDKEGFIYVSSFVEHKNHKSLIKAWEYLLYQGVRKKLTLVTSSEAQGLQQIIKQSPAKDYIFHKIGLSRDEVYKEYKRHEALVFPSSVESLGLPLLEAQNNGLAVIAAEKDYVRDIIEPDQSFDPSSYISIARSIMRYLDFSYNKAEVISSEEFINKLLEKTKVSAPKAS